MSTEYKRISDYTTIGSPNDEDLIPTVHEGANYNITFGALKAGAKPSKIELGLDQVDNTRDIDKPVSNNTQVALNLKADKSYVDSIAEEMPHISGGQEDEILMKNSNVDDDTRWGKLTADNIDWSTMPIAFDAYISSDKNGFPVADYTTVVFDVVTLNIGDGYNPSTGRFAAPVRGIYQFNVSIILKNVQQAALGLYKNSSMYRRLTWNSMSSTTGSMGLSASYMLQLEAGDTVEFSLYIYDAGDVLGTSQWSGVNGYLVSRI